MTEEKIFEFLEIYRKRTLSIAEQVTPEQADIIPNGFSNSIRWHLGHILFIHERLAFHFINEPLAFGEEWQQWFGNGSKPASWKGNPPSIAEIQTLLKEQFIRVKQKLSERLNEKLAVPFRENETVGQIINYATLHEAFHAGSINAMKKTVQSQ